MAKRDLIEEKATALVSPILEENSFELVDVEYVKEAGSYYLRVYIDKPGGITIDDCELVSRAFSLKLDEEDYIDDAYIMEVSSPGLLRPIKKDKDFERNLDKEIEIKTYQMIEKRKDFVGVLVAYDKQTVTIMEDEKERVFNRSDLALIRPYVEF